MTRRVPGLLKRLVRISTLVRLSAVMTLIGLALMVWSMLQPTPMPVILAMSVGQGLGTLAFALFCGAVAIDQIRKQRAKGKTMSAEEIAAGEAVLGPGVGHGPTGCRTATPDRSPPSREVSP
jgi:hypothetical protein